MHIPDAFIPITQSIVYWIIALVFIALSLRWARTEMTEEKIPLVAVLAAGLQKKPNQNKELKSA